MKFTTSTATSTVEILAADDFVAIPFTVTATTAVKAGTPMTLDGLVAPESTGAEGETVTQPDGILLYDVDPTENPNAALLVQGVVDARKVADHAGITLDAAALKTAVPGIIVRDNTGVNE